MIAFDRPWAYAIAVLGALSMAALLVWSGGFLQYYARTGWEFDASLSERFSLVVVAVLFGALLPLEVTALSKARAAAAVECQCDAARVVDAANTREHCSPISIHRSSLTNRHGSLRATHATADDRPVGALTDRLVLTWQSFVRRIHG